MYRVKKIDGTQDLGPFSRWLDSQGVAHRFSEENGQQVLWLTHEEHVNPVLAALDHYLSQISDDGGVGASVKKPGGAFVRGRWQPRPAHAPLTFGILVLAAILAWVTGLGQSSLSQYLFFADLANGPFSTFGQRVDAWLLTLSQGQFWRLLTPEFLHLSVMHILFNAVMFWFLGSQIEYFEGKTRLLIMFFVTAMAGNLLQYLISGPLFGGLSSVVYGAIGYCWLSQVRYRRFQFPPALVGFSLVWLLIGFTPIPEWLGMGRMANEAHLGGFIAGVLLVVAWPAPKKNLA